MKILKAVKGRKAQKGQYVVTVLVNEAELTELAPEQFSEMKMAISPVPSLDKEVIKWIEAYRVLEDDVIKTSAV